MTKNFDRVDTQDGRVLFVFDYLGNNQGKVSFDVTEFSQGNMMINATNMAKMFPGKKVNDFLRLDSTNEYLKALESVTRIPASLWGKFLRLGRLCFLIYGDMALIV